MDLERYMWKCFRFLCLAFLFVVGVAIVAIANVLFSR